LSDLPIGSYYKLSLMYSRNILYDLEPDISVFSQKFTVGYE